MQAPPRVTREHKVVVLGEANVGKTSLLRRYAYDRFEEERCATVAVDFVTCDVERDARTVTLAIWDTAGQERYAALATSYARGAHAALLVYDASAPRTFVRVVELIAEHANAVAVLAVVATKADLVSGPEAHATLAARHRALTARTHVPAFVCSALNNVEVSAPFEALVDGIEALEASVPAPSRRASVRLGVRTAAVATSASCCTGDRYRATGATREWAASTGNH